MCCSEIVMFSITIYNSHINKKQAVTSQAPPLKTAESLTSPTSSNDLDLPAKNNTEKNQNQRGAVQKPVSNKIQTQETASTAPSDGDLIYDILQLRRQSSEESVKKLTTFLDHDSPAVVGRSN